MPKLSKIQTHFDTGEIAQSVWGRVDVDRYDASLETCLNYLPIVQGPILRRPGTKYVANVKDSTNPPILIPFKVSETQSYVLEFGNFYCRFFTQNGQITVAGSSVTGSGLAFDPLYMPNSLGMLGSFGTFYSVRANNNTDGTEGFWFSNSSVPGAALEMVTPYGAADLQGLRWSQKEDTLYLTNTNFRPYKLQRVSTSGQYWNLKPMLLKDGPYKPFNTRDTIGDSATTWIKINSSIFSFIGGLKQGQGSFVDIFTGSSYTIFDYTNNGNGLVRLSVGSAVISAIQTGDLISIDGQANTTNFLTDKNSNPSYWNAVVVGTTSVDINLNYNGKIGTFQSSFIRPYVFKQTDPGRLIAYSDNGSRYWGMIVGVTTGGRARAVLCTQPPDDATASVWQLGVFSGSAWPQASTLHQNRLYFAGSPNAPEELDGSVVANYELFQASGSNFQVTDANAVQFSLLSNDVNPIRWLKSSSQGLLGGTLSGEWIVSPSTANTGITPTNVTAQQFAAYGTANIDAVPFGNQVLYIQKGLRKVRELNYFFQAGSFRSSNLSELAEHLTLPSISQLAVQKEIHPAIWGLRTDGQLISLTYNRDDVSVKAGWARHVLGGQSDTAGSPPVIKSMAMATASSAFYEELWVAVQRSIAGSNVVTVEYMTRPFDYTSQQEDAYYLDCGATFDQPLPVQSATTASSCVITVPSHGFTASSQVRFYSAVGLNLSTTDVDGNTSISNLVNEKTFTVSSVSVNAFKIQDFLGNDISSGGYTSYLGSAVVRKLVTNITGLTWLANEQVSILADGGIHVNTSVSSTGSLHLAYPAAKVQIGYGYNSDAQLMRTKDGSAQGTSIGSTRRVNRVAFMLHNVAELSVGPSFTKLLPIEFPRADVLTADNPVQIVDGIFREGVQGTYTYDDDICFRQSAPLPGMIQAVVRFLEEFDV